MERDQEQLDRERLRRWQVDLLGDKLIDQLSVPFLSDKLAKLRSQLESLAADLEKTIAQSVNQEQLSAEEVYAALNPVAEHLRELAGVDDDHR